MRKITLVMLLVCLYAITKAQVNRVEYFIDIDPGLGKGTFLSIQSGNDVAVEKISIPLNTVPVGLHNLYVRARDKQGRWSLTNAVSFFCNEQPAVNKKLKRVEYFVDTDPGLGKATAVPLPANQDDVLSDFVIDLKQVASGIHTFNVRALDAQNRWSHTAAQVFNVKAGKLENITAVQYNFIRAGFESAMYTYKVPKPSPSVSTDFQADLSKLPADREYTMQIFAIDQSGVRSLALTKKVKVCSEQLVKAGFDHVAAGTKVSFIDTSAHAVSYKWDYGDGQTDTVSNPEHVYSHGGIYTVKLIAANFCNADTLTRKVAVLRLNNSYPSTGGNTGTLTLTITGGGFTKNTTAKLTNGISQIIGYDIHTFNDGTTLYANFELYDQQPGKWNLIVTNSSNADTITNALSIEIGKPHETWVDITGRNAVRAGTENTFKLRFGNSGNIDAKGNPVWLVVPAGTQLSFEAPILALAQDYLEKDSIPLFFTTDTLFGKQVAPVDVYPLIIPLIPAGTNDEIPFSIKGVSEGDLKMQAMIFRPIYGSPPGQDFLNCFATALKDAFKDFHVKDLFGCPEKLEKFYDDNNKALSKHPCASVAERDFFSVNGDRFSVGDCSVEDYYNQRKAFSDTHTTLSSIARKGPGVTLGCIGDLTSMKSLMGEINKVTVGKFMGKIFSRRMIIGLSQNDYCGLAFVPKKAKDFLLKVVNSLDPNEKVGPVTKTKENYVDGKSMFTYSIFFENLKSATAPAQEVIVMDSLDGKSFDLKSVSFNGFGFGEKVSKLIKYGASQYASTIDLRPHKNLMVRVDAKIDTTNGLIRWRFLSLDPLTMDITNDPYLGFLPPNKVSPEGQGYVSFSVNLLSNLATDHVVNNSAVIYFDANKPITTNIFSNWIDKQLPQSSIQQMNANTPDSTFTVSWKGNDSGSGIADYNLYYTINGGPVKMWLYHYTGNTALFTGKKDSTYAFYSVARDNAGNIESPKTKAEATTTVRVISPQEITFPDLPEKTFGDTDFTPMAKASSGLAVSYQSSNTKVLTLVNGKLHITGAGTAIITANQLGNDDFAPANPVTRTVVIKRAVQRITFEAILPKKLTDTDFKFTAKSSAGLPLAYTSSNTNVLAIRNGSGHITGAGEAILTAEQQGDGNYLPATPVSQPVKVLFSLSAENFQIGVTSLSCRNSNNGSINIKAVSTQNYKAIITGIAGQHPRPFSDQLNIEGLSAGAYDLCIRVDEYPDYEQCFHLVLTEPKDLAVYSTINERNGELSLHVEGSENFTVVLNGQEYNGEGKDFNLPLQSGSNHLKITSSNECQGVYEKTIDLPATITIYPNPFEHTITIEVANDRSGVAEIEIHDLQGKLVYKGKALFKDGLCSVGLHELSAGIYIVKLQTPNVQKRIKVIKK